MNGSTTDEERKAKEEKLKKQMEEFETLCKPLNDWLQNNYHPHTMIIIQNNRAEIVETITGVPFKVLD